MDCSSTTLLTTRSCWSITATDSDSHSPTEKAYGASIGAECLAPATSVNTGPVSDYDEPAQIDGVQRFDHWHEINRGDPIEALELLLWETELAGVSAIPRSFGRNPRSLSE